MTSIDDVQIEFIRVVVSYLLVKLVGYRYYYIWFQITIEENEMS